MSTPGGVQYIRGYPEYIRGYSVHQRDTMSISGVYHEYVGGDIMSTSRDVKYIGGYHEYVGGYHEYIKGCSVHRGIS